MKESKSELDGLIGAFKKFDFQGQFDTSLKKLESEQHQLTEVQFKFLEIANESRKINQKAFEDLIYLLWEGFQFYFREFNLKMETQERLIEEKKEITSFLSTYSDRESELGQLTLKTEGKYTPKSVTIKNKIV